MKFRYAASGCLAVAAATAALAAPSALAAESTSLNGPAAAVSVQQQVDDVIHQYGGRQIAPNQIAWKQGKVVMTVPAKGSRVALAPGEKAAALGTANCSKGYSCLYQDATFGGRRLSFYNCGNENLGNYGFRDQTSSWHNNQTGGAVSTVYNLRLGVYLRLWSEPSPRASAWVGAANNDKADLIHVC